MFKKIKKSKKIQALIVYFIGVFMMLQIPKDILHVLGELSMYCVIYTLSHKLLKVEE